MVTGAGGFVGGYLLDALRAAEYEIYAYAGPHDGGKLPRIDLTDRKSVERAVEAAYPDVIFHLAAQTFVPTSLGAPLETYVTNTLGTAHLAHSVRRYAAAGNAMPRIVFASSSEVYGQRSYAENPLSESLAPRPANPYSASKAAAEAILLGEAQSFGLDVVIARAFNHIGPGQSDRFVVSNFAEQLARIARGEGRELLVGNLEAKRDYSDVRDVVAAYVALAQRGQSGEIYNVCSGVARSVREVLRELILVAHVPVEVREDPARMRPSDVPLFVGENAKLRAATGWEPQIPFARSIREVFLDAVNKRTPDNV